MVTAGTDRRGVKVQEAQVKSEARRQRARNRLQGVCLALLCEPIVDGFMMSIAGMTPGLWDPLECVKDDRKDVV